jgi:hypothetical protein
MSGAVGVVAVPLQPAPSRRLYAVWRTATARRPAVAVTLAALKTGWRDRDTAYPRVSQSVGSALQVIVGMT